MSQLEGPLEDRELGPHTTALLGERGGKYPDANALLVRGFEATALIDAPLGVARRIDEGTLDPASIDLLILTHAHEDHVPGMASLPEAEVWIHSADRPGLESLDAFLEIFGYPEPDRSRLAESVAGRFRFVPRPDARAFEGGHRWDLGGVTLEAIHAPGHTRGHCLVRLSPDDVIFLADLELSSFGPYYADAWSDLDDFERTLERAESLSAGAYVSGHHVGVIDEETYGERLRKYRGVIARREQRLLEHLAQPRTLDEIVEHRLVYRPHDDLAGIGRTERATALRHLRRLEREGRVRRDAAQWRSVDETR